MEISHKTQAALQFLVPTVIIYSIFGAYLLNGEWPTLSFLQEKSAGLAILGIGAMLVQDLIPKPIKEFLVFLRMKNRMPGHRAFSPESMKDPNIDWQNIPNQVEFSTAPPATQQQQFYKLYRSVSDNRSVNHYSQRYIAWRDLSVVLVILCIVSVPILATFDSTRAMPTGFILAGGSFFAYLLTSFAARNVANGLVVQVLSLIATGSKLNG